MDLSKAEPVAIIRKTPPTRRTVKADGSIVAEKLSPNPYSAKMVTPVGNVTQVPMTTGRALAVDDVDNRYWGTKEREKLAAGFVYYGRCPNVASPCTDASDEHACECVEQIITKRQAVQTEKNAQFHEQFKTAPERFYDAEMKREAKASKSQSRVPRGRSSE